MKKSFSALIILLFVFSVSGKSLAFEPNRPECLAAAKLGGGLDLTCRLAANALLAANLIDTPMIVSYKPGGIGAVAYNQVGGVRNDDPQLIVSVSSGSTLNIDTKKFGRYDENAVRWLGALGAVYGIIAVSRDAQWQTLNDLVRVLIQNPRDIFIGGGGSVGSQDWMKTALVVRAAKIDPKSIRYVAYEGGGEAVNALFNGDIQVFPGDAAEVYEYLKSGEIRVLAVLSETRLPGIFSNVPTAREQGYPVDWAIWRGYYMGMDVSEEAYNWWANTFRRLVNTEEFDKEREKLGLYPFSLIGSEFDDFVKASVREQRQLAIDVGLIR